MLMVFKSDNLNIMVIKITSNKVHAAYQNSALN